MDIDNRLALSYYHPIATINESHKVYLVQHQETKKVFVKKELSVYNLEVFTFLKDHPIEGIPQIELLYEDQGTLTVIEEYVTGQTLQELVANQPLDESHILKYTINLCEIVEKLHNFNPPMIHRDIKPSNILISSTDSVILLDFNAAKNFHNIHSEDTVLLGTQGYAAPEQYGFGSSRPQTDIYSIGVVLKKLIVSLPKNKTLEAIADKCTQLDPDDRYAHVSLLKEDLLACLPKKTIQTTNKSWIPGFRSGNPWKMIVACIYYLFSLTLSLVAEFHEKYFVEEIFAKLTMLCMLLAPIVVIFNVKNIHSIIPLCKNENKVYAFLGKILLFTLLIILIITVYVTLCAIVEFPL